MFRSTELNLFIKRFCSIIIIKIQMSLLLFGLTPCAKELEFNKQGSNHNQGFCSANFH